MNAPMGGVLLVSRAIAPDNMWYMCAYGICVSLLEYALVSTAGNKNNKNNNIDNKQQQKKKKWRKLFQTVCAITLSLSQCLSKEDGGKFSLCIVLIACALCGSQFPSSPSSLFYSFYVTLLLDGCALLTTLLLLPPQPLASDQAAWVGVFAMDYMVCGARPIWQILCMILCVLVHGPPDNMWVSSCLPVFLCIFLWQRQLFTTQIMAHHYYSNDQIFFCLGCAGGLALLLLLYVVVVSSFEIAVTVTDTNDDCCCFCCCDSFDKS